MTRLFYIVLLCPLSSEFPCHIQVYACMNVISHLAVQHSGPIGDYKDTLIPRNIKGKSSFYIGFFLTRLQVNFSHNRIGVNRPSKF